MEHVHPEDLAAADLAQLDQNWSDANAVLDECLALNEAHRLEGCPNWFCGTRELSDIIVGMELHEVQMVLRAAMERLRQNRSST